jgi:pyruvate,orthophosphate dikinase
VGRGVFTGLGALNWLPDLDRWSRVVDGRVPVEHNESWEWNHPMSEVLGSGLVRLVVGRAADPADPMTRADALAAVTPADVEQILHPQASGSAGPVVATGLGASPGVASGVAVFDAWRALDADEDGLAVILVRPETSPADEPGLAVAVGVLTSRGGLTSHAAVVARGRGLPAVCGADSLRIDETSFTTAEGLVVNEGEAISIDGSTGEVFVGSVALDAAEVHPELDVLLDWADEVSAGHLTVRANADTPADAAQARAFGAEGIGLCRTEHMFLGADRLPLVQRMILADGPEAEAAALGELHVVQLADFEAVLEAMDGLPVTVRLLDPPLHEFLPDVGDLEVAEARGELDERGAELLAAARAWHEHNPMLGVRGVRLAVLKPGLYRMQVRALIEAALARIDAGGTPLVQVMVPLISTAAELALARAWIEQEAAVVLGPRAEEFELRVGAMVETPRAALRAGDLAETADFLSFGTNDLTQMTFGFSRDDVGRILDRYLDLGLLDADPFATLDVDGVGELVAHGVERARERSPGLELGVCGEHGGDPASIAFFVAAGLDYVSCSPFRVPVARLAAARAVLGV